MTYTFYGLLSIWPSSEVHRLWVRDPLVSHDPSSGEIDRPDWAMPIKGK